ncbi:glycosyltransferase [Desulforamulus ruminis]|nr:glycosyltransferase [Desulforamulus ruminis]
MGADDFIWDIVTMFRRSRYRKQRLDLHKLDSLPPKLLAMVIAAWREDNVLGDVINNIIASTHYPKSMYHIFLGIYPNDAPTLAVANELAEKYENVHVIINEKNGPTSKAQNINYVIKQIKQFELERQWSFASITIHDSEDVVHPFELKVTNALLDKHPVLQFPVFPLIRMPKFRNFFKNITTGTYADEFAENHFITLVSRYHNGAFVPSAGTGFVLSKETIRAFGDEDILPKDSLTEDFRLSLTLFEKGIDVYYVLERVPRINDNNKLVDEFIATRSIFPNTFKQAVNQKARWILGITMQSFKLKDVFTTKGIRFVGRYSLYKDLKAKVVNLLVIVGYPVLIYFLVSLFIPLEPIYPMYFPSWYLSLAITVMMIERQLFRSVAIYNVYGMRSVFFACLFPPLLPIRLVWGNIINMTATVKAYKQRIFGNQTPKKKEEKKAAKVNTLAAGNKNNGKKQIKWDKTDHDFIGEQALKRFHRKLGDVLLEKGYVTTEQLKYALDVCLRAQNDEKQTIGNYLLEQNIITEEQLLDALSHVKHIQYLNILTLKNYRLWQFASVFDEKLLRSLLVVPLLKTKSGYVFAFCDNSPIDAQTILRNKYDITVKAVFVSQNFIMEGLDKMFASYGFQSNEQGDSVLDELYTSGIINYEQLIIAHNYITTQNISESQMLQYMGLLGLERLVHVKEIAAGKEMVVR